MNDFIEAVEKEILAGLIDHDELRAGDIILVNSDLWADPIIYEAELLTDPALESNPVIGKDYYAWVKYPCADRQRCRLTEGYYER